MVRTQIYLPEHLKSRISFIAKRHQKAQAEVIRELIAVGIRHSVRHERPASALVRLSDAGLSGPSDASLRLNDYLYGAEA